MLPETQSKRTFVFRKYYKKYKHLWILLYFFVYMAWFNYVEKTVTTHFHVIHVPIDDYIPFCEYFVIPYLLWFPFVGRRYCPFGYTVEMIKKIVIPVNKNAHNL